MKTFKKWAEENKVELPLFTDAPEGQTATSEIGRSALAMLPPAAGRGQYGKGYFMSRSPTAALDMQNADNNWGNGKKKKMKKK